MRKLMMAVVAVALCPASALAGIISVDLSSATTGASIIAPGASFAQHFAGQFVAGTGITGSPINPLILVPAGTITVESFDPGVSPASNSLLSQPDNQAPLSVLLDQAADSITWTMGYGNPPSSMDVDLFAADGSLVNTTSVNLVSGYHVYMLSGLGT